MIGLDGFGRVLLSLGVLLAAATLFGGAILGHFGLWKHAACVSLVAVVLVVLFNLVEIRWR